jgi:hypothetical protein
MKKESISFSWDKYITGKYKVETTDGRNVILSGRNPDAKIDDDKIIGWYGDEYIASSWADDGCFLHSKISSDVNLVLIPIEEELEPVSEKTTDYAELPEELPEGEFYGFTDSDYRNSFTKKLSTALNCGIPETNIVRITPVGVIKSKKVLERI